jgi:hypothetical protein
MSKTKGGLAHDKSEYVVPGKWVQRMVAKTIALAKGEVQIVVLTTCYNKIKVKKFREAQECPSLKKGGRRL